MLHFAGTYFESNEVLEPCCGTGQITRELYFTGYKVTAFDIDDAMVEFLKFYYPEFNVEKYDFREYRGTHNQIIANPPYEQPELTAFLRWILDIQTSGGISVLLLPKGFVEKGRPKELVNILHQFSIQEKEDMREPFLRTSSLAEIIVLKKF
jgi:16S rRNA A1518/A1519 N6-dimethyltransferase RsmA/KsgA/DIM1 with predicted DNA glycosylase/AP lyase activity